MEQLDVQSMDSVRPTGTLELDTEMIADLQSLIDSNSRPMVLNILADVHPADIASLVSHLSRQDAGTVLGWLTSEVAGDVIVELDDDFRAKLLDDVAPPHRGAGRDGYGRCGRRAVRSLE